MALKFAEALAEANRAFDDFGKRAAPLALPINSKTVRRVTFMLQITDLQKLLAVCFA